MTKKTIIAFSSMGGLLSVCLWAFLIRPQLGGIYIVTNVPSIISIDDKEVGLGSIEKPFKMTRLPGEILLKLVSQDNPELLAFERRVQVAPGIETIVRHEFANDSELIHTEILSFEKIPEKISEITIVSTPDSEVFLNSESNGKTPIKLQNIEPGKYKVELKQPGFASSVFSVQIYEGYKLMAYVQLPKKILFDESISKEQTPTPAPATKIVEILPTQIGYLPVLDEPSLFADEIGRVAPGRTYIYVGQDTELRWVKIVYDKEKEGWIDNKYAKIITP